MFTDRPRNLRTYLNDASIKALKCANAARTGMSGDPVAAGAARMVSASLAEVRDALDLRAPWLTDYPQVASLLLETQRVAGQAPFRIAVEPAELARMVVDEVTEARAGFAKDREDQDQEGAEGREEGGGVL